MIKSIQTTLALFLIVTNVFSQITITENNPVKTKSLEIKITPYDSSQNWVNSSILSDYEKYIGLNIYLPPNKDVIMYTDKPYLMSLNPSPFPQIIDNITGSNQEIIYETAFTNIYNPKRCATGSSKQQINILSNETSDKYYTIIDVLYNNELDLKINSWKNIYITKKKETDLSKEKNKNWKSSDKTIIHFPSFLKLKQKIAFKLLSNKNDTIYYLKSSSDKPIAPSDFILVPYFLKQKKMYLNKNLISLKENSCYGSRFPETDNRKVVYFDENENWICKDVTLLKPNYKLTYILENKEKQQVTVESKTIEKCFIYKEEYIKRESEKMRLKEEDEKDYANEKEKEKIEKEKLRNEYIQQFGSKFGNLVADGKVDIGMSKEMCQKAYGYPGKVYQSKTESGTFDVWKYEMNIANIYLYFLDDKLKKIEQN